MLEMRGRVVSLMRRYIVLPAMLSASMRTLEKSFWSQ